MAVSVIDVLGATDTGDAANDRTTGCENAGISRPAAGVPKPVAWSYPEAAPNPLLVPDVMSWNSVVGKLYSIGSVCVAPSSVESPLLARP